MAMHSITPMVCLCCGMANTMVMWRMKCGLACEWCCNNTPPTATVFASVCTSCGHSGCAITTTHLSLMACLTMFESRLLLFTPCEHCFLTHKLFETLCQCPIVFHEVAMQASHTQHCVPDASHAQTMLSRSLVLSNGSDGHILMMPCLKDSKSMSLFSQQQAIPSMMVMTGLRHNQHHNT